MVAMKTLYQKLVDAAVESGLPFYENNYSLMACAVRSGDRRFIGLAIRYWREPTLIEAVTYDGPIWLLDWIFSVRGLDETPQYLYGTAINANDPFKYLNWLHRHGYPFHRKACGLVFKRDATEELYNWFAVRGAFLHHK